MTKLIAPCLLLALTALSAPAAAQSAAAAEALFSEGRAALDRGDLETACRKLRESDRLDPANGTKFNLADCEEKRGRLASAWELYRKLADTLPAGDERTPYVTERATALEPKVPRLTIELEAGAPADTTVKLGVLMLTSASFGTALPVDPGKHTVVASVPGGESRSFDVTLSIGERRALKVTPLGGSSTAPSAASTAPASSAPASSAPASSAPASSGPVKPAPKGSNTRTLGYVLGGVGVAGLAVGTVAGVITINKKSEGDGECNDELRLCSQEGFDANQTARTMGVVSTVGFAVGLAGLGAGMYFILSSSSDEQVAVGTRLTAGGAAVSVDTRW